MGLKPTHALLITMPSQLDFVKGCHRDRIHYTPYAVFGFPLILLES